MRSASVDQSVVAWWTLFHDDELTSLMARAVQSNLDVQIAQTRVRAARIQQRMASAAFAPSLNATASYTREKESRNAPAPVLLDEKGRIESPSGQSENLFQAGFDAQWELDLFGGQQRAVEEARVTAGGVAFDRDATVLSLLAEVARIYIELRATQVQIALVNNILTTHMEFAALTRARYTGGLTAYGEVAQAELLVRGAQAQIAPLESSYQSGVHRLSVLLGQWPGALADELRTNATIPVAVTDMPTGLPSDLLRQRPDVLRSERGVALASARVGVATADLYPRFTLNGTTGLASVSASDFFSSASLLWKIGPTLTWPILRRGQLVATVEIRNIQLQEALLVYRKVILSALEEVENAIAAYTHQKAQQRVLGLAVGELEQSVALARSRYAGGLADRRDMVTLQTSLMQARADIARSDAATGIALVTLYKALGGGWSAGLQLTNPEPTISNLACAGDEASTRRPCSTSP